jgi:asparagine synthase (glutamine-hydrolysing)
MCGITGIVWTHPSKRLTKSEVEWMTHAVEHRGPDGHGVSREEYANGCGFAMGHRRLAIIDQATGGQPMANANESVHLTFNGEIYNYRELRQSLEQQGCQFRTLSDTETILHAYERYGENFVDHLRGMFAIGLWDSRLQKLILARDRLGEKPLVFCRETDRILFASEIKSLRRVRGIGTQIRPEAIDQYLRYGYIPHPWTAYQGIEKLPPGHIGIYQNGSWKIHRYWQPQLMTDDRISFEDACDRVRQEMDVAIRLRMRSDVPMGAFLSGGMDSSVVVGLMQQYATSPVQTFTVNFFEDSSQENLQAEEIAGRLGTKHRQIILQPNAIDSLDHLVTSFDEPFADSSAIATYFLSQWTSNYVRVVMTGDGGDELFGGYARYETIDRLGRFDRLPRMFKKLLTGAWVDWIPSRHPESPISKLQHRLRVLRQDPHARYSHWVSLFSRYQRESLYHPDYLKSGCFQEKDSFLIDYLNEYSCERSSIRAMRADLHSYLPCDILAKVDITSMAHGLESRSPFLDHELVEAVGQFPYSLLHQRGRVKPLLGKTFEQFVTLEMMQKPKVGFGLPMEFWRRSDFQCLANDLLRSQDSFCSRYLRSDVLATMLDEHASTHINHGERLWSLVFLESWARSSTEGSGSARPEGLSIHAKSDPASALLNK